MIDPRSRGFSLNPFGLIRRLQDFNRLHQFSSGTQLPDEQTWARLVITQKAQSVDSANNHGVQSKIDSVEAGSPTAEL